MAVNLEGVGDARAIVILEGLIANLGSTEASSTTREGLDEGNPDDAALCRALQKAEYESRLAIYRDQQVARELQRTGLLRGPRRQRAAPVARVRRSAYLRLPIPVQPAVAPASATETIPAQGLLQPRVPDPVIDAVLEAATEPAVELTDEPEQAELTLQTAAPQDLPSVVDVEPSTEPAIESTDETATPPAVEGVRVTNDSAATSSESLSIHPVPEFDTTGHLEPVIDPPTGPQLVAQPAPPQEDRSISTEHPSPPHQLATAENEHKSEDKAEASSSTDNPQPSFALEPSLEPKPVVQPLPLEEDRSISNDQASPSKQLAAEENNHKEEGVAEASSSTISSQPSCVSCGDDIPDDNAVHTPCEHSYCQHCLRQHFTLSLSNESLFPPSCCDKPIPIDEENQALLGGDLVSQFHARKVELSTPAMQRNYCHEPDCNRFIPRERIHGDMARCTTCNLSTCTTCKRAAHWFIPCPATEEDQALLLLAEKEGWTQCSACHSVVELDTGCFHMSKSFFFFSPSPLFLQT